MWLILDTIIVYYSYYTMEIQVRYDANDSGAESTLKVGSVFQHFS